MRGGGRAAGARGSARCASGSYRSVRAPEDEPRRMLRLCQEHDRGPTVGHVRELGDATTRPAASRTAPRAARTPTRALLAADKLTRSLKTTSERPAGAR